MRKLRLSALLGCGLLAILLSSSVARADELYGKIRGVVTDPSGAVVGGAKLSVTSVQTGVVYSVTSGGDGSYEFLQLPAPADYNLRAEHAGFKVFEAANIHLDINHIFVQNATLEVGAVTQTVTVEATTAQVETTSMQLGADITASSVVEMPLNGRNWVQLQQTLPGVVASSDRFTNNYSTNGARTQANGYLVNGTDSNDLPLNTPLQIPSPDSIAEVHIVTNTINPEFGRNSGAVLNAVTKSGTNGLHGDGFEFFRDTSLNTRNFFSPTSTIFHQNQFGGTVGGPIKKDKAFFFFSYQGTRARQPDGTGNTVVFTPDERTGAFPALATSTGSSPFALVGDSGSSYPAGTAYSTIFSGGYIPSADLNSVATGLLTKYVPLANAPGNSYRFNPITTSTANQEIARIDHNVSQHDAIWGYGFFSRNPGQDDLPFIGANLPGFPELAKRNVYQYTLAWSHSWGGGTLNELRFGYNRFNFLAVQPVTPVLPSSVGFTGINPQSTSGAGVPTVPILGFFTLGFSDDGPQPRIDQTYQATDNFSKIAGKHTLKFGFEMRRAEVFNPFYFYNNGGFTFNGTGPYSTGVPGADFLLGVPDFYVQSSGNIINARTQEYYFYGQDQWKIRRNLTLTYGTGYQIDTPLTDTFNGSVAINCFRPGETSTVYPTAPTGLVFPGDSNCTPSGYKTLYDHFGPRLGFAYSPGSSGKWSIRGGVGVYYNVAEEETTLQNLLAPPFALIDYGAGDAGLSPGFATPFTSVTGVGAVPNKYPFYPPAKGASVDFGFYEPMSLNIFDPKYTVPSSINYNLTVERELPGAMILSVGYVGLQGRHLENTVELNPAGKFPGVNPSCVAIKGCGPDSLWYTDTSAFPYNPTIFGSLGQEQTTANSSYNSLQVSVNKHFTHGLQFLAAYGWSHSLDYSSSFENSEGLQNPFALYTSHGDSAYDARQRFVLSYVYNLPSVRHFDAFHFMPSRLTDGWQITGITTLQTGFPITLSDSSDASFTCNAAVTFYGCWDRPNTVGPVQTGNPRTNYQSFTIGGGGSLPNYWFNPNSFTPETPGVVGDTGRNFFHGPGLNNFDFALMKDTNITADGKRKLELRFEFFNIMNHAQFSNPDGNVSDPNFGRIFSTQVDSRIIQLAAKFYF